MPDQVPNITVSMPAKPAGYSKTLWFNLLVVLCAAAEMQVGLLQPLLPVDVYQLLVFVLGVGNAGLRFLTTQGVRL
jgi:hypothetical protein